MPKLEIGVRVYNGGDRCNEPHFGTITGNHIPGQVQITPDKGSDRESPYWVYECGFSEKYLGHGGTRFVTEEAYNAYRDERMAQYKKAGAK